MEIQYFDESQNKQTMSFSLQQILTEKKRICLGMFKSKKDAMSKAKKLAEKNPTLQYRVTGHSNCK